MSGSSKEEIEECMAKIYNLIVNFRIGEQPFDLKTLFPLLSKLPETPFSMSFNKKSPINNPEVTAVPSEK